MYHLLNIFCVNIKIKYIGCSVVGRRILYFLNKLIKTNKKSSLRNFNQKLHFRDIAIEKLNAKRNFIFL